MIRGYQKFVCNSCGHKFRSMDVEWQATVYSMPPVCPQCGSRHTRPWKLFGMGSEKAAYEKIWAELDKMNLPQE